MLSETARRILGLIAEGRSHDQILQQHPDLTYFDICAAAREALELVQTAPLGPTVDGTPVDEASPLPHPLREVMSPAGESPPLSPPPKRPSFVERARATHGRAFARWSRDEHARLERLFRAGTPRSEIARQLDRHDGAITRRLEKLGLISVSERADAGARRDRQPSGPSPAETPGGDEPPLDRPTVPGWDLFRQRLSDESGVT